MEKNIVEFICKICDSGFTPSNKSNKSIYCSKKCYGIGRTGYKQPKEVNKKISLTKRLKGNFQDKPCEVCGKILNLNPYWIRIRRTCSRKCAGELNSKRLKKMWKNPPPEMIENMRLKMIQRRSRGRLENETKPEKIFREELEKRNIVFSQQFAFGGMMIADFFIPSLQAFIFCDGSYWHNLPSSLEKDWQQIEYIRAKGMKAYRFSDIRIINNIKDCVDEVFEDAEQAFSFGEIIDKYTILFIKTQHAQGDKLKQAQRDYRRMDKLVMASFEFYNIKDTKKMIFLFRELFSTNDKLFELMEREDQESYQRLKSFNLYRSRLKNAINEFFNEREEIKI